MSREWMSVMPMDMAMPLRVSGAMTLNPDDARDVSI